MSFKSIRNHKLMAIIVAVALLGFVGSGAAFYVHTKSQNQKPIKNEPAPTLDNQLEAKAEDANTTPQVQPQTNSADSTRNSSQKPTSHSTVTKKCASETIKYKFDFAYGNYANDYGSVGYKEVCNYSDGTTSTTIEREPVSGTIYINSRSTDLQTAKGICEAYINAYIKPYDYVYALFDECMQIAHGT